MPTPEARLAAEEGNLKALERAARLQPQYRSLGQHAMELAMQGVTSMTEAIAVTGSSQVPIET